MNSRSLRENVLELLRGGGAHLDFDAAIADLPPALRGARREGVPFTPWRLIEHMRIAQRDILAFSTRPDHVSPPWPDGYWPSGDGPARAADWDRSIRSFRDDAAAMQALVADESTDLLAPLPWGKPRTILREALLVADHNAYHLGQFITVRRLLGAWPEA